MRVLIADGGTGGHIFPAIALADELRARKEVEAILFTGTPIGLESELVPKHHYPLRLIHVGGLIGKGLATRLKTLIQLPLAYMESRKIIQEFKPQIAIGFGAYPSGPALLAAHHKNVPILLVEPNAIPGFTNRILLKYARKIAVPYEDKQGIFHGKAVVTGNPIRPIRILEFNREKFTIGILGGSQGSRAINVTVTEALPELVSLRNRLDLIHQTGKTQYEWVKKYYDEVAPFYEVTPFIYDVEQFYNRCDLIICRAGAITLAEITSVGKPSILIPLPSAAHNHQEQNARRLMDAGAARMILQKDFTKDSLMAIIEEFLSMPNKLGEMAEIARAMGKPEATKRVADLALSLANPGTMTNYRTTFIAHNS